MLIQDIIKEVEVSNPEELVNSDNPVMRCAAAAAGCGLAKLSHDEDEVVRMVVAEQGYGLDELAHDESVLVRLTVANQGYDLDFLAQDENPLVRYAAQEALDNQTRTQAHRAQHKPSDRVGHNREIGDLPSGKNSARKGPMR